ncbi:LOB domain-containing protein 22 [Spatholobus suberectus]|nr:LOB domain-containing protein 22 [Spatholobus suberectus]
MDNSMSRSTAQACAACKYQRRKCGSNCILAPYFPHDRQKQFLNAHRLFGVGKITNMIKPLDPQERDIAMSTIIYQSDMRDRDPTGGCYRLIQQLQSQIEYTNAELHLVLQHLAFFRAQANSCDIVNATPQPYLEQTPLEQQQQQQCINYNHLQEDISMWAVQNSIPLSSLLQGDITQDPIADYGYDQKPVLDLMNK